VTSSGGSSLSSAVSSVGFGRVARPFLTVELRDATIRLGVSLRGATITSTLLLLPSHPSAVSCGGGPADLSAAFLNIVGYHVVVVLQQVSAARVQIEAAAVIVVVEAVVEETAHVLAAGDAGPELAAALDASGGGVYGWWLMEEHEHAMVAYHRVREGIQRDGAKLSCPHRYLVPAPSSMHPSHTKDRPSFATRFSLCPGWWAGWFWITGGASFLKDGMAGSVFVEEGGYLVDRFYMTSKHYALVSSRRRQRVLPFPHDYLAPTRGMDCHRGSKHRRLTSCVDACNNEFRASTDTGSFARQIKSN
jgi:hypothetical protein